MKDFLQYQSHDGFNVIVVVWENGGSAFKFNQFWKLNFVGARASPYSMAAANARVLGACIGFFIDTLAKTFGVKNDMIYLIGHGLGAHAAGYAGKRLLDPKIHRITGLDPAGELTFKNVMTKANFLLGFAKTYLIFWIKGTHFWKNGRFLTN